MIQNININIFFLLLSLPVLADFSIDVKYLEQEGRKFIITKGYQSVSASSGLSFREIKNPKKIPKMSRYVLSAKEVKQNEFEFRMCFLFFCRSPYMEISNSQNTEMRWLIPKGGFQGSYGKYWVEAKGDRKSFVRFESKVEYTHSKIPSWAIRWGMKTASKNFMESMKNYIESQQSL